ncbi:MAG: AAA family ATPase [Polyangiales bacterium]
MLHRLRVKNFKLLRDVEIEFGNPLTVLIGPNAGGKSTVLEVIEFLRKCADRGLQEAVRRHGGAATIRSIGSNEPIEIETEWSFLLYKVAFQLRWTLSIDVSQNTATVRVETVDGTKDNEPIERLRTDESGNRLVRATDGAWRAISAKPTQLALEPIAWNADDPLAWLWFLAKEPRMYGSMSVAPSWLRDGDIVLASPRDSVVIAPEPFIKPDGQGLANALYNLFTEHSAAWDQLLRAVQSEFSFVHRIVFPPDGGGSKISFAIEDKRFDRKKVYASQLSDGFISYLVLLTVVLQPDQFSLLLLDEPESHLHPSALRRLVSLCASDLNAMRRVIIATHSNALLDFLPDPAAAIRIIEHGPNGALVRKLDPEALAAWRKDYTMSELRAAGQLDKDNSAFEADA